MNWISQEVVVFMRKAKERSSTSSGLPRKTTMMGIIFCADTDEDIARYSILHENEQLFASKYKLYLPSEKELRAEIETQKQLFYLQQEERKKFSGIK